MNLTPTQREDVRLMYGARCAYCGNKLGQKWHADHVAPVQREGKWVREGTRYKHVLTGVLNRPERDTLENLKPACVPCNIDKHDSTLEQWRKRLEQSAEVLRRNYSTYRHALRFNLIVEAPPKVVFYFERYGQLTKRPVNGN
jgi:5-methylcytosine-specific restriction endonuclease McrA